MATPQTYEEAARRWAAMFPRPNWDDPDYWAAARPDHDREEDA